MITRLTKSISVEEQGENTYIVYTNPNTTTQKILFNNDGIEVDGLDVTEKIGANLTPATRTNNPLLAANTINANLSELDNAIGNDSQITPLVRTIGVVPVSSTVHQKIDALDTVIGSDAQMPVVSNTVSLSRSIYQNLKALDTYKSLRTAAYTIGGVSVADCDFNFVTAANQNEQPIDLGAIIPALARVVDIFIHTSAEFTGAITLVADVGLTTGAADFIASATIFAADAILATADASMPLLAPAAAAQHVWVNSTPGANWSNVTAGKATVYVTFIDVTNVT